VPETVGEDGCFFDHVPLFAGQHVYKVNDALADTIENTGGLLARGKLSHRYPHSWRSKAPLIFRNTTQWFISMEKTGLRDKALKAIEETRFVPPSGQKRLRDMIETRPDWCVSRQRAWGVPITVFVNKETGEPLRDPVVLERIVEAVEGEGADAWFSSDPSRFLGDDHNAKDYEQVMDILDVWFDSGATHTFVLEDRDDLKWPASLYLEGTDQHRGWFHSSLLESCGTRGRAPYEAVLTHGFVMGEDGSKMSKSTGNIVSPQDVIDQHGADVLRLWVVGSDYSEDLRIGPEILKRNADIYRRLRNTLRYLLGNLAGFLAKPLAPLREELLSIYGIGEETADDIIVYAANQPSFVIDTYTRRIMDRLGMTPDSAKPKYSDYQAVFYNNLPPDTQLYNEFHALWDYHAKMACAKTPRCKGCCLLDICPTGRSMTAKQ